MDGARSAVGGHFRLENGQQLYVSERRPGRQHYQHQKYPPRPSMGGGGYHHHAGGDRRHSAMPLGEHGRKVSDRRMTGAPPMPMTNSGRF